MYGASVAYPADAAGFDVDYFRNHHAPSFARMLGDTCVHFESARPLEQPGAPLASGRVGGQHLAAPLRHSVRPSVAGGQLHVLSRSPRARDVHRLREDGLRSWGMVATPTS